jgi:hypothetical protein
VAGHGGVFEKVIQAAPLPLRIAALCLQMAYAYSMHVLLVDTASRGGEEPCQFEADIAMPKPAAVLGPKTELPSPEYTPVKKAHAKPEAGAEAPLGPTSKVWLRPPRQMIQNAISLICEGL